MPNGIHSESTSATSREEEAPVRRDERVTAAVGAHEKQDAVAARVNRHQAAVAATVRAQQAAAADGRDAVHGADQGVHGVVRRVVRALAFPYQLGRTVVREIGSRRAGGT